VTDLVETYDTMNAGTGKTLSVSALHGQRRQQRQQLHRQHRYQQEGVNQRGDADLHGGRGRHDIRVGGAGLSGTVSGFVGTDNQGNATTGHVDVHVGGDFGQRVGSYAINGSRLTATTANYTSSRRPECDGADDQRAAGEFDGHPVL